MSLFKSELLSYLYMVNGTNIKPAKFTRYDISDMD